MKKDKRGYLKEIPSHKKHEILNKLFGISNKKINRKVKKHKKHEILNKLFGISNKKSIENMKKA